MRGGNSDRRSTESAAWQSRDETNGAKILTRTVTPVPGKGRETVSVVQGELSFTRPMHHSTVDPKFIQQTKCPSPNTISF